MRILRYTFALIAVLTLHQPCHAQLSSRDLDAAKQMVKGTFYLRIDLPCRYYSPSAGFGVIEAIRSATTQAEPIVQVSSLEARVHSALPDRINEDIRWYFRPNDPVRYGKLYSEGGSIDVWMEGLPPNNHEVFVTLVGLKTLNDFKAAFDRTFSKVPLQDEHPEWPDEIRKAIAERRVIPGMTPEQAYCVVGKPMREVKSEQAGSKVETWYPRQAIYYSVDPAAMIPSDFPASLKFVDGKLTEIGDKAKLDPLPKFPEDFLQQARMMLQTKLYLRIDVCYSYGVRRSPVIEVSPDGVDSPSTAREYANWLTYWSMRVNDPVAPDQVRQSGGVLEVRKSGRSNFMVLFVGIKSMDDFKAAFNRTFSTVPLQDEHPEWSAEVRKAIGERLVLPGMTPEQVYCVTGKPASVEKREANGAKVEIWRPREKARVGRDSRGKTPAGFASTLETMTFVNGELAAAAPGSVDNISHGQSK
jgi:hypothetical protein